jgi:serine O-acetyltransferase
VRGGAPNMLERTVSLRNLTITLWHLSRWLYRTPLRPLARVVKTINLLVFGANLEPEADVAITAHLGHMGLGTTVHGSTIIGEGVVIWQQVTIGCVDHKREPGSGVTLERNVEVGAHAIVLAPRGQRITIGEGARIGAGAIVRTDVPAGAVVVPEPSPIITRTPTATP